MPEFSSLDWSTLPAITVIGLVMIFAVYVIWKQAQINAAVLANALTASATANRETLDALKGAHQQSREFHAAEVASLRLEVRRMESRVAELEEQLKDKDARIAELERKNEELHDEVSALRQWIDMPGKKADKPKVPTRGNLKPKNARKVNNMSREGR